MMRDNKDRPNFDNLQRQVDARLKKDAKSPLFQTLKHALYLDRQGRNKEAIKWYRRCQNDPIALERLLALSPLELKPVNISPLTEKDLPAPDKTEKEMLDAINSLLSEKRKVTQKAVMAKTDFSQKKTVANLESLLNKGLITKFEREYRTIAIVKTAKERGQLLVFSPESKMLCRVVASPTFHKDVDETCLPTKPERLMTCSK